jgi:hypothetical protein
MYQNNTFWALWETNKVRKNKNVVEGFQFAESAKWVWPADF